MTPTQLQGIADTVLDKLVVPGYSRLAVPLRRRWWPADPAPEVLRGTDVVITGASSGLGKATAIGVGRLGARVHLVGRTQLRLDEAAAEIRASVPAVELMAHARDISDLYEAGRLVQALRDHAPHLHALVHCAGVMPPERTTTPQGHEAAYATHVLGPQLITWSLRDRLAARGDARVVIVSSGGMYTQPLQVDDVEYTRGTYKPAVAYARTKRMQVVLAEMLAQRFGGDATVHSMHPGWAATPGVTDSLPGFGKVMGPVLRSAEEGADTIVWLAGSPEAADTTGGFWQDRRVRPTHYFPWQHDDAADRERWWELVCEATGVGQA